MAVTTGNIPASQGHREEPPVTSHLQEVPTSPPRHGSFLPTHDSGLTLGTRHTHEQGYNHVHQYTDVQSRHHTGLPPSNSGTAFAHPYDPNRGYPYASSSSSTRPSWYDMTVQQRHPMFGADSFQYLPVHYAVTPPYTHYQHSMSSPPMSPTDPVIDPVTMYHPYIQDERNRVQGSFR